VIALIVAILLTIAGGRAALTGSGSRLPFIAAIAVAAIDVALLVLSDWVVPR
jgi:hypothetical protein